MYSSGRYLETSILTSLSAPAHSTLPSTAHSSCSTTWGCRARRSSVGWQLLLEAGESSRFLSRRMPCTSCSQLLQPMCASKLCDRLSSMEARAVRREDLRRAGRGSSLRAAGPAAAASVACTSSSLKLDSSAACTRPSCCSASSRAPRSRAWLQEVSLAWSSSSTSMGCQQPTRKSSGRERITVAGSQTWRSLADTTSLHFCITEGMGSPCMTDIWLSCNKASSSCSVSKDEMPRSRSSCCTASYSLPSSQSGSKPSGPVGARPASPDAEVL
mmetsp:Transcript_40152/g.89083  ORF Transcript_40152/g.89083 Transcript_40152/m.89083 type:complete len:272 (+) Transcript_40152:1850-2665(+)